jgi:hypothetical protein
MEKVKLISRKSTYCGEKQQVDMEINKLDKTIRIQVIRGNEKPQSILMHISFLNDLLKELEDMGMGF